MNQLQTHWDKIRPQFDTLPYPDYPLEMSPRNTPDDLATHNCVIPHYWRDHHVIDPAGKWILDAGCGSGYQLLALAIANPGANIVGVDISPKSLELAQQRLAYHQIENPSHFHCLAIEELPDLPDRFDYINCDDVLYLLEDPVVGLQAMKSVLKPNGIIRTNMHSSLQRAEVYRVQQFFSQLGYLEGAPTPDEIDATRQTMTTLNDWVISKRQTWRPQFEINDQAVLMNHLFRGDRGITLAEFFALLQKADLEFITMVNWRRWNLEKLFKNIEKLPTAVAQSLAEMSTEQQLHMFELLHPVHRLLDLYCGHPGQKLQRAPVAEWHDSLWQRATVCLHPQLNTHAFRQAVVTATEKLELIPFDKYLLLSNPGINVDSAFASCLLSLLESPQTVASLQAQWLEVCPPDWLTRSPTTPEKALRSLLIDLEQGGYAMLEISAS